MIARDRAETGRPDPPPPDWWPARRAARPRSPVPRCADCGTKGGYVPPCKSRPWRKRLGPGGRDGAICYRCWRLRRRKGAPGGRLKAGAQAEALDAAGIRAETGGLGLTEDDHEEAMVRAAVIKAVTLDLTRRGLVRVEDPRRPGEAPDGCRRGRYRGPFEIALGVWREGDVLREWAWSGALEPEESDS